MAALPVRLLPLALAVLLAARCSAQPRSASGDYRDLELCEAGKLDEKTACTRGCAGAEACFQKCEMDWQCPCADYAVVGKERTALVAACLQERQCGRARVSCRRGCVAGAGSMECLATCELAAVKCECECNAAPAALRPAPTLLIAVLAALFALATARTARL